MFEFSQLVTSPPPPCPSLVIPPSRPPAPYHCVCTICTTHCAIMCVCSTFYHSDIRGTFVKIRELQYTVTVLLYCTLVQNDARNCDAELHCEVRVKYNAVISAPTSDLPVLLPPSTLPITSNPFHPCLHSPIVSMSFEDVSDHFPIGIHFNFKSFNF